MASERVAGADDALRDAVLAFATSCRGDISELRVAQGWQDLTGQRMKQVSGFLSRIQVSVLSLVQLAGSLGVAAPQPAPVPRGDDSPPEHVDDLLVQFGFCPIINSAFATDILDDFLDEANRKCC